MKSIVTENEKCKSIPPGVTLVRDARDGQVLLRTEEGHYVSLTPSSRLLRSRPGVLFNKDEWNTTIHLEPFNGSITLSNE